MATTTTPSWTDAGTALISPVTLARGGATLRATLDLRTKYNARLFVGCGRGGTTALTPSGVYVIIRQLPGNGALRALSPYAQFMSSTSAAILKQVNFGAGYAAGTTTWAIDGTGTPAIDDWYCSWGKTAIPAGTTALPDLEFLRCSNQSGGTSITWDAPCLKAVLDNYIITSKADYWSLDLAGGSVYEVLIDYLSHTAGEAVAVGAWYSIMDSVTGVTG